MLPTESANVTDTGNKNSERKDQLSQRSSSKYKVKSVAESHDELFDYLAYHGVKSHKAEQLEKIKAKLDTAECTFQPTILSLIHI